eukprot:175149_1
MSEFLSNKDRDNDDNGDRRGKKRKRSDDDDWITGTCVSPLLSSKTKTKKKLRTKRRQRKKTKIKKSVKKKTARRTRKRRKRNKLSSDSSSNNNDRSYVDEEAQRESTPRISSLPSTLDLDGETTISENNNNNDEKKEDPDITLISQQENEQNLNYLRNQKRKYFTATVSAFSKQFGALGLNALIFTLHIAIFVSLFVFCLGIDDLGQIGLLFIYEFPLHAHILLRAATNYVLKNIKAWNMARESIIEWWTVKGQALVSYYVRQLNVMNPQRYLDLIVDRQWSREYIIVHIETVKYTRNYKKFVRYMTKTYNFNVDSIPDEHIAVWGNITMDDVRDWATVLTGNNDNRDIEDRSITRRLGDLIVSDPLLDTDWSKIVDPVLVRIISRLSPSLISKFETMCRFMNFKLILKIACKINSMLVYAKGISTYKTTYMLLLRQMFRAWIIGKDKGWIGEQYTSDKDYCDIDSWTNEHFYNDILDRVTFELITGGMKAIGACRNRSPKTILPITCIMTVQYEPSRFQFFIRDPICYKMFLRRCCFIYIDTDNGETLKPLCRYLIHK